MHITVSDLDLDSSSQGHWEIKVSNFQILSTYSISLDFGVHRKQPFSHNYANLRVTFITQGHRVSEKVN